MLQSPPPPLHVYPARQLSGADATGQAGAPSGLTSSLSLPAGGDRYHFKPAPWDVGESGLREQFQGMGVPTQNGTRERNKAASLRGSLQPRPVAPPHPRQSHVGAVDSCDLVSRPDAPTELFLMTQGSPSSL